MNNQERMSVKGCVCEIVFCPVLVYLQLQQDISFTSYCSCEQWNVTCCCSL